MRSVVLGSFLVVSGSLAACSHQSQPLVPLPPAGPIALSFGQPGAPPGAPTPAAPAAATASASATPVEPPASAAPLPPRTRSAGEAVFLKSLGSLLRPRIAAAADGVVLAASAGCDDPRGPLLAVLHDRGSVIVVAKLDDGGKAIWTKTFLAPCGAEPTYGVAHRVAGVGVDRDGNVTIAGELRAVSGPVDFGGGALASAGGSDVFVASFDATGKHRWSRRFGDDADQRPEALAVSPEGLVAITGSLAGSADFGGGAVRSAGKSDAFIAVLDANGKHVASHAFGDAADQKGELVAFGAQGALTLAGTFEGAIDFGGGPLAAAGKTGSRFLAQYRDSGAGSSPRYAFAFSKAMRGELLLGALASGADGTFLAGAVKGTADLGGAPVTAHAPEDASGGPSDVFVVKLDATGKPAFARAFGAGGPHRVEGLAVVGSELWLAASFRGMTRFGDTMMSAGDDDALLVRLDERGEVRRAWRFGDTFAQSFTGLVSAGSPASLFLLGRNEGTIDMGIGPHSWRGDFLARVGLDPLATAATAAEFGAAKAPAEKPAPPKAPGAAR